MTDAPLTVVGIGADGWDGLGAAARAAVSDAALLVGSTRQLALVPAGPAERRPWPSPMDGLLDELAAGSAGPACILASGDPMLHGIGSTLARIVGPDRLTVYPHPSAFSLACARLAWPAAETALVSAVGRPASVVARLLQPGRRLVVYTTGATGAAEVADVVRGGGFGPSRFVVLVRLGADDENIVDSTADGWGERRADPLHTVAVECRPGAASVGLPVTPGLPEDAYESDGQLTKREVRAIVLAALAPMPGQLLWDLGAGSGSIGIEWLRAEPSARAIAVERRADRADRATRNAVALGVPYLEVRCADSTVILDELDAPDAVFVGGGLTAPGLLDRCWSALRPRGRIVANAVTLESERMLQDAHVRLGGRLARVDVSYAEPLGSFTTWRAQAPVVVWSAAKEPT